MKCAQTRIASDLPEMLPIAGVYQVIVVGGGIAGCAAALAAARSGVKVCLIEREFMVGGLATLGLVWCYLPICDGNGNQISSGICEEFLKLSVKDCFNRIPMCWQTEGSFEERKRNRYETEFNPLSFASNLEELLLSEGVAIRYGSQLCSVTKKDNRITSVVVSEKEGLKAICCENIIDASGDADVCYLVGDSVETRADNRLAYWLYSTDGETVKRRELQTPLLKKLPDNERRYSGIKTEDITDFCVEGRRRVNTFCKENGNQIPVMMATIPQIRMTRRLVGKYTLLLNDEGNWFDDSVGMIPDWRYRGSVFCVPYRMLLSNSINNLWVAGRCASAEADAGDTIRSIPACAVLGQAAGTAAAIASQCKIDANAVPISFLQTMLEINGVIINKRLLSKRIK